MDFAQLKFGLSPRAIILSSRMHIIGVVLSMYLTPGYKMASRSHVGNPDHTEEFSWESPHYMPSTVGLILNPNTNKLSPQYHCIYDDYFETVNHKSEQPPPSWEDLVIKSRFKNDLEHNIDDNWEQPIVTNKPVPLAVPNNLPATTREQQQPVAQPSLTRPELEKIRPTTSSDKNSTQELQAPPTLPDVPEPKEPETQPLRR